MKNADADDSGLSGIVPLILFSLIGLVLIALVIPLPSAAELR